MTRKTKTKTKKPTRRRTPTAKKPPRGQLTDAECDKISRILDRVIAGKLSLAEGERQAEAIRARARRR